jgi:hypothetical protein
VKLHVLNRMLLMRCRRMRMLNRASRFHAYLIAS